MHYQFYIPNLTTKNTEIILPEEESHHIIHVLRMKTGETIRLTNGKGLRCNAVISDISHGKATCTIENKEQVSPEKPSIILAAALIKESHFEWLLEKATELGVSEIVPLITKRVTHKRFRRQRLEKIIVSAMKQSQRCYLPVLHEPIPVHAFLTHLDAEENPVCILFEKMKGAQPLSQVSLNRSDKMFLTIGPEGGFTDDEVDQFLKTGFIAASLGEYRLRAETAAITALAQIKLRL
ncbi:MAG: 16S rRNA (uracil(1498)-N(3))-methyltransferase [Calditrichia bacterium]